MILLVYGLLAAAAAVAVAAVAAVVAVVVAIPRQPRIVWWRQPGSDTPDEETLGCPFGLAQTCTWDRKGAKWARDKRFAITKRGAEAKMGSRMGWVGTIWGVRGDHDEGSSAWSTPIIASKHCSCVDLLYTDRMREANEWNISFCSLFFAHFFCSHFFLFPPANWI